MLDIMIEAALEGGKVLKTYFRKNLHIRSKTSHQNIVTEADDASQKVIKEYITSQLLAKGYKPDDIGFIGEEGLMQPGTYTFIIDPLDGTSNFASGSEEVEVLIALVKDGEVIAGVAYCPMLEILYYAEKGKGAYRKRNGEVIKLAVLPKKLEEGMMVTYMNNAYYTEFGANLFKPLPYVRGVLVGTCSYAGLVDNVATVELYGSTSIWDIAAWQSIVREAGGVMCDWKGNEIVYQFSNPEQKYNTLVCHPDNKTLLLEILNS
ncbi:MAG: inositol monophosphatase [Weeksellaceae bacterium]